MSRFCPLLSLGRIIYPQLLLSNISQFLFVPFRLEFYSVLLIRFSWPIFCCLPRAFSSSREILCMLYRTCDVSPRRTINSFLRNRLTFSPSHPSSPLLPSFLHFTFIFIASNSKLCNSYHFDDISSPLRQVSLASQYSNLSGNFLLALHLLASGHLK